MKAKSSHLAFSYVRFSHPDQAKGDSLRRQTEAAAAWCEANGVTLDTATSLRDLGKSAYTGTHRTNPDRHALAAFLKLVEAGNVPRGSYLILENLDRLTREHIQPALLLALNLLQAGIRIVQLKPAEMVFDDQSDTMPVMMMMMELARGHGESAIKSERVGRAWQEKKRRARESGEIITHRLPAWIEERGGELRLVSGRAAIVKRIFALAAGGYGHASIVKRFTEENVPAFGDSGHWVRAYIANVLKDRRAVGEFQPRLRNGKPDGPAIAEYFPAAVSESEWLAARAGAAQRRKSPGRIGTHVNVFAGLLHDAIDGSTLYRATRADGRRHGRGGKPQCVLINTAGAEGRTSIRSFNFTTFERVILAKLHELLKSASFLNGADAPDDTRLLAGELEDTEDQIAKLEAELLQGEVAAVTRVLRRLEAQQRELADKLAHAKQKAAHPLSEACGKMRSLLETLDSAPDQEDKRLRVRSEMRRIVDSIWVVIVPRGRDRLAGVQVWFVGGEHRDYVILHRPPKGNGAAHSSGLRGGEVLRLPGPRLDLRKPADALGLQEQLLSMDIQAFVRRLPGAAPVPE
jgi:DNA invertase Pin-like site-specific DNA recombinase